MSRRPVVVANCSGFFGDRLAAAREQVEGGPIDVLTGDWLAELTMLILARQRLKNGTGYARTFLDQLEQVLGTCLERGIKVVSNAGGLDPHGCAEAVAELAGRLGLQLRIATVTGDDLVPRWDELATDGFRNTDTGEAFAVLGTTQLTANAYLGGFGIASALRDGADVVVTGRVTDAALVVGPAAWWHGWTPDDRDQLAGAVVAGHVIECGAQATGGNYPFFADVPGIEHVGFPLAEVAADGSAVITKHPGTGGMVTEGTVKAQLLYEVAGPAYPNPDVTARFDTIRLSTLGPDRVRISEVRGVRPPATLKVAVTALGGFRNDLGFMLTGLDLDAKAEVVERQLWAALPGGRAAFDVVDVQLRRSAPTDDPQSEVAAQAELRVTVKDRDAKKVGRAFTARAIELALASVPGLYPTAPPGPATPFGVYWPTTVPSSEVPQRVSVHEVTDGRLDEGKQTALEAYQGSPDAEGVEPQVPSGDKPGGVVPASAVPGGPTRRVPLGLAFGARSGDKGGDANIGVWGVDATAYAWLSAFLTVERIRTLMPETAELAIDVHLLPNLHAVNVVVHGLLGRGVADGTGVDPQGKALGEYLRARLVDLPEALLGSA